MGFGIMRIERRKMGAVGGIEKEACRTAEQHEAGKLELPGSEIDWSRTENNIRLVESPSWKPAIQEQVAAAGVKPRKDSVALLDGLYTASAEWLATQPSEKQKEYFEKCLEFHVSEFCQGDRSRVVSAVIHLDETTPHLHIASVPLFRGPEGEMHLSAKSVIGPGRSAMRAHQDHFFEAVSKEYGLFRGQESGRKHEEQSKHRITELKRNISALEANEAYLTRLVETAKELDRLQRPGLFHKKETVEVSRDEIAQLRQRLSAFEDVEHSEHFKEGHSFSKREVAELEAKKRDLGAWERDLEAQQKRIEETIAEQVKERTALLEVHNAELERRLHKTEDRLIDALHKRRSQGYDDRER